MDAFRLISPNENWIVDVMANEVNTFFSDKMRQPRNHDDYNLIWLLSDWVWNQVSYRDLKRKHVLTTIHHIVPSKHSQNDWDQRDAITDAYHVFNERTYAQVKSLTFKPVHLVPYWCNSERWTSLRLSVSPEDIRLSLPRQTSGYPVSANAYLVGSFQRDTEGLDLKSPKLEKGPDKLADALIKLRDQRPNLHVVLAGWRRQYIIARLEHAKITYTYFELPSQQVLNELYNVLDLYLVTARHEGGPQSLLECGLTGTPCVSTPVGIAEQVLPPSAINDDVTLATPTVPNVTSINVPGFVDHDMRISHGGLHPYLKLLKDVAQ